MTSGSKHTHRHKAEEAESAENRTVMAKTDKVLNVAIIIGLVIVGILAGLIFLPGNKPQSPGQTATPKARMAEGLSIRSELSEEILKTAASFLKQSLKAGYIPKELDLPLSQKGQGQLGDSYVGTWNVDGKFFSILVGGGPDPKIPAFIRVWTIPAGESVTKAQADALAKEVFAETYLTLVGDLACQTVKAPNQPDLTDCARLKTQENGSLVGVAVKAPISLSPPPGGPSPLPSQPEPPKVTIVSSCFVPKEGTATYTAPTCL